MGAFEYTAVDNTGRQQRGVQEADTLKHARQRLRERGLLPLQVGELQGDSGKKEGRRQSRTSIGTAEVALITRQLATLARSGMPVVEALTAVAEQSEKRKVRNTVLAVRSRVMEGYAFADALNEFPGVFPEMYRATVAAGEQAGHLEAVLERLADYMEERKAAGQKIMLAFLYPLILVIVSLLVVVGLLTYVVPEITRVFETSGQTLPGITVLLINLSDGLREHGVVLGVGILVALFLARQLYRIEIVAETIQRQMLRLPVVGRLVRGHNTAQFTRTLSILSASGVPILDALRVSARVVSNLPMRKSVVAATAEVREGVSLSAALEKTRRFPVITLRLIGAGEAGGNLDTMLERAADAQDKELDAAVALLLGVLEPILILLMGGIVLFVVLATLLPIFDMNQLVR